MVMDCSSDSVGRSRWVRTVPVVSESIPTSGSRYAHHCADPLPRSPETTTATPARPSTMPIHMTGVMRSPRIRPATVATSSGWSEAMSAARPPSTPLLTPSKMR